MLRILKVRLDCHDQRPVSKKEKQTNSLFWVPLGANQTDKHNANINSLVQVISQTHKSKFLNEPLQKVVDDCFRCMGGDLATQRALNAFDTDSESFKDAITNAWQRLSDERKAQRLRRDMETMTETSLLTMRLDHRNNQRIQQLQKQIDEMTLCLSIYS